MKKDDRWQAAMRMHRIVGTCSYTILAHNDGETYLLHYSISKAKAKNVMCAGTGLRLARALRDYYKGKVL